MRNAEFQLILLLCGKCQGEIQPSDTKAAALNSKQPTRMYICIVSVMSTSHINNIFSIVFLTNKHPHIYMNEQCCS